jgi:protoporphyrinogen oxidase
VNNSGKKIVIIGGGPAGLTAGLSFLQKSTEYEIIILESENQLGGLSRTHQYKGNRMDIGGHRFFSKSDEVMQWWLNLMPVDQSALVGDLIPQSNDDSELLSPEKKQKIQINYQGKSREIEIDSLSNKRLNDEEHFDFADETIHAGGQYLEIEANEANSNFHVQTGNVPKMLIRNRLSRIYYLRKFFKYPINLSWQTLRNLGIVRVIRVGISYVYARLFPIRNEKNLEEFFINRFGKELYKTFFQSYTEKVWGVKCSEISAEWGAQRIKGLSITEAIKHALFKKKGKDISQKNVETSLIERFLYPELGPGQMWELVGQKIQEKGGQIILGATVNVIGIVGEKVGSIEYKNSKGETIEIQDVGHVLSSMPIQHLINEIKGREVPKEVKEIAEGLIYRDFITVGLLLRKFKNHVELKDNWIYIQESDVRVGRLQIFNNWSPSLVENPNYYWVGLEYFCQQNDDLWSKSDEEMIAFAREEMVKLNLVERDDILDGTSLRVPKTYPAYFGSYDRFDVLMQFLDSIPNLYPIGRNGMHRYNNQDHSMLTAFRSVDSILYGNINKKSIWEINTEMEYHEEK